MSDAPKPAAPRPSAPAPAPLYDPPEDRERLVALLGSVARAGDWLPPEELTALAALGNVSLDFRQAELPPGVTSVKAIALMGSVLITVPKELEVELSGSSFMGSVEHRPPRAKVGLLQGWSRRAPEPRELPKDGPVLCIRGTAILGNVTVKVV